MSMNVGVPCKLLKEFKNKKVTVEVNSGEIYRGILLDADQKLSVSLGDVKATFPNGNVVTMNGVYIRGTCIRIINLPDSAVDYLPKFIRPEMRTRLNFRRGSHSANRERSGSSSSYNRRH